MIEGLAEADTRIDVDGFYSGGARCLHTLREVLAHVLHHITILRVVLHCLRISQHVHEDDRCIVLNGDVEDRRVVCSGGYVVDHVCTCL